MIKKTFKDFILTLEGNSSTSRKLDSEIEEENPDSWEKHKDFLHKFHQVLEELPNPSWTQIAKSGSRQVDSEEVWYDIKNELRNVGLKWEDVEKNKEVILDNLDTYSSLNAYVDIILYNLDDKYNVGGNPDDIGDNWCEAAIKYRYGYHQTTYGRIFLKRYWGSVENFFKKFGENILRIFVDDTHCIHYNGLKEVFTEVREEGGLVKWEGEKVIVFLEAFWDIANPYLEKSLFSHFRSLNYQNFKTYFRDWLEQTTIDLEVEDYDSEIEIDFSSEI